MPGGPRSPRKTPVTAKVIDMGVISDGQRELVRASFELLRPQKERAGQLFYDELFALAPGVQAMFEGVSIMAQGGKLMQVLEYAVDHLDQWPDLSTELEQL